MVNFRAFYEWSRRRPWVFDVGVMALLSFFTIPNAVRSFGTVEFVVSAGLVLPLFWRRSRPVASFTAIALTCAVQAVLVERLMTTDFAFLISLYSLSAYASKLWIRLCGLGVGLFGALIAVVRMGVMPGLSNLGMLCVIVFAIWLLGDLLRTRRAHVAALEERARRLEYERDQQARIARSAERARIAREMHDVVAHSLAIVIAQADGGRYAADTDPEAAKQALETIGQTGRRASSEMRRLLGVLKTEARAEEDADNAAQAAVGSTGTGAQFTARLTVSPTAQSGARPAERTAAAGDAAASHAAASRGTGAIATDGHATGSGAKKSSGTEPEYSPQPGVERLPELIEQMRSGGLSCDLDLSEPTDPLPEGLSLAAYRVVQEALTNALKHGGPGVHVEVELRQQGSRLLILVRDNGRGAAASSDGDGHGLSGMSERVQLFGGSLTTGPCPGGGFRVHAEIPIRETASAEAR